MYMRVVVISPLLALSRCFLQRVLTWKKIKAVAKTKTNIRQVSTVYFYCAVVHLSLLMPLDMVLPAEKNLG